MEKKDCNINEKDQEELRNESIWGLKGLIYSRTVRMEWIFPGISKDVISKQ